MANNIVSVTEITKRGGSGDPKSANDVVILRFEMDTLGWDFWQEIYPDRRCPKVFQFNRAQSLFVVDIQYAQVEDAPQCCDVTFKYSDQYDNSDGAGKPDGAGFQFIPNPTQRPAVISHGSYKTRKSWETDVDGLPFCTTAGEPIPYEEEIEYPVISITKNLPSVSTLFATQRNFMNSDTVRIGGFPYLPKTLAVSELNIGSAVSEKGYVSYPLSFNLYYNPDTWEVKLRNAGYTQMWKIPTRLSNGAIVYAMRPIAIKVGNPPQSPNHPMPLINDPTKREAKYHPNAHGQVFPDFYAEDPTTGVIAIDQQAVISPERLKQIWEMAKILRNTKIPIRFNGNLPLS